MYSFAQRAAGRDAYGVINRTNMTDRFSYAISLDEQYRRMNSRERELILQILEAGGRSVAIGSDSDEAIQVLKQLSLIRGSDGHYSIDPSGTQ